MRIIPEHSPWSPYPDGLIEACRSIEHDASFFMGGFGDENTELPPLPAYPEGSRRAVLIARLDAEELRFVVNHRPDLVDRWPVGKPIDEQVMAIKAAHFAMAKTFDDKLEPKTWKITAENRGRVYTSPFVDTPSDAVLEMGMADTEHVRVQSAPYVEMTVADLPSDGIPIAIGADESTTPKTPPKGSTAVFTDSEIEWGRARSSGMDW